MPLVSCPEDQMEHRFHQLPQDRKAKSKVTDKYLSVDIHGNSPHDGSQLIPRSHSSPLNTEKQIQAAIFRLSNHVESTLGIQDSSKSGSINEWNRPSNLGSELSIHHLSPVTVSSWTPSSRTPPRSQPSGTWASIRRPNPKLAMVRRVRGSSALQLEMLLDSNMQIGNVPGPSAQQRGGLRSFPLSQLERTLTSRPLTIRSMPSFAVKACIRLPSWQTEALYRFPTSATLQSEGLRCKSNPCTAPGSPADSTQTTPTGSTESTPAGSTRTTMTDSTQTTPASTPVISAAGSEMSTLRSLKDLDEMIVAADSEASDEFTIDTLRTHLGNVQVLERQTTRPQIPNSQATGEQDSSIAVSHAQDPNPTVLHPLASHPNISKTQLHNSEAQNVDNVETGIATFDLTVDESVTHVNSEYRYEAQNPEASHRPCSMHVESSKPEVQKYNALIRRAKGFLRKLKIKHAQRT